MHTGSFFFTATKIIHKIVHKMRVFLCCCNNREIKQFFIKLAILYENIFEFI